MPIKVLLVDDNQSTLLLWERIVDGASDLQVVGQASNGRDAVRLVTELHPDVILMDVMMPVMNGLDATREIMSLNPTPIIVTSANFTYARMQHRLRSDQCRGGVGDHEAGHDPHA